LALVVLLLAAWSCGDGRPAPASVEDTLARERVAAHFRGNRLPQARAALAPLLERKPTAIEDLVRAAAIELADSSHDTLGPFLERGLLLDRNHPALRYMRAQMALQTGRLDDALADLEVARASAPEDLPTGLHLAAVLYDLGRGAEAEAIYRDLLTVGIEHGGSWYISALYRLSRIQLEEGRGEAAAPLLKELSILEERGLTAPASVLLTRGNLGWAQPPPVAGEPAEVSRQLPTYTRVAVVLPEIAGARLLRAKDLDGDRRPDLVATGGTVGLAVARRTGDGLAKWEALTLAAAPVVLARAFDLGNDDDLDFVLAVGNDLHVLVADGFSWTASVLTFEPLPAPPTDIAPVDFDHDGDLDLLIVGPFGARLLRNDGASKADQGGAFTDVTAAAGLPTGQPFAWCLIEDFDGDQDVDLLLGGAQGMFLADNQRAGRYADGAAALGDAAGSALGPWLTSEPLVAAIGASASPALIIPRATGRQPLIWRRSAAAAWTRSPEQDSAQLSTDASPAPWSILADLNLDGSADLVSGNGAGAVHVDLQAAGDHEAPDAAVLTPELGSGAPLDFTDIDGDLDLDGLRATADGCEFFLCSQATGNGARLEYLGLKDNKRAVGAVVEVRAGAAYRRIFWDGDATVVGVGARKWVDVMRVTWPNGVIQTELDLELSNQTFVDDTGELLGPITQDAGLIGSCPFLYAWNGETFTFISDVLGITPLGLPMAPGMLVPPDHDEFVLVRGDQLKEKDGLLELQFTEELREVTYLDRARLDVVDHPTNIAIYPDERFTFPPFPKPHTHTVRAPLSPTVALGSDGRDWAPELAKVDDVHSVPFTNLAPQFLGLATPHTLDLTFDGEKIADAKKLRLVFTGWFFWTDASVNMASARTPGVEFVPPLLQVPDPANGPDAWRPIGPPVGFPAGKTKTMVIDVTGQIDPTDPRIRIFSTLRLYWDRIALAVDDDDAPLSVYALEPVRAHLWRRGFSAPTVSKRADLPERFDWDHVAAMPRWNQHPGNYTRYGDTLELLGTIDDRFAILGAGDALALSFDGSALPPVPEGWTRDYILFLDGWAKDRDPNTIEALEVEPLPHHGMTGYPYGEDTPFPADDLHEAWREEYNTRPAYEWIVPLSPAGERHWFEGQ
jgi:tetratricopeptide (TPR) repeat protein